VRTAIGVLKYGILGAIMLAIFSNGAIAQVAGDGTLGTQVNGNAIAPCTGTCIITNGATRGANLFHSFRQFSLPNGDVAGFVTTPAIQNVIVRVTGVGSPFISNINGTIAASNPANFFLLNPNGILFGSGHDSTLAERFWRRRQSAQGFVISGIVRGVNNAPTNQAGAITIDATATVQLTQGAAVANEVPPSAIGQGGNINITAATIQAFGGSNIATRSGGGKAENLRVAYAQPHLVTLPLNPNQPLESRAVVTKWVEVDDSAHYNGDCGRNQGHPSSSLDE
jgi:filamentous hemagglutinin family protein